MLIIGYIFTIIYSLLLASLLLSVYYSRKHLAKALSGNVDSYSLFCTIAIMAFFVAFSLLFVHPVSQLYFDESIYQGIALNILHNGNALWCQYGYAYASPCLLGQLYHDPAEYSFYIAIAFAAFGANTTTAYYFELAVGALSILLVFLTGSVMFGRRAGVASAVIFAMLPELFIWSRTQAVTNMGFMMFTTLAFFAFVIYKNKKNPYTKAFFLSALSIAVYIRIEAVLLVPIFALLIIYEERSSISRIMKRKQMHRLPFAAIIFLAAIAPQLYYIAYMHSNGSYGAPQGSGNFSIAYFKNNAAPNLMFFLGSFNQVSFYPAYFSIITTIAALIGAVAMVLIKKTRFYALLLGLWVLSFHIFYDFFYAGAVTYGVDVRFMLVLFPAMAIYAGFGISALALSIVSVMKSIGKRKAAKNAFFGNSVCLLLLALFAVMPFVLALPTVTILPSNMPQQALPLSAVNFIYSNYASVPANCLVFTFTPDIWYELNRSAAEIGYLNSPDPKFVKFESGFRCFVLDKGYWCDISGYKSECSSYYGSFNTTALASSQAPGGGTFEFVKMNNYKP